MNMKNLTFPARINVNFELAADVDAYVRQLNGELLTAGFDEISFSNESKHLPHLTLLMGDVQSRSLLETMISKCESIFATSKRITYTLSPPFWKKPSQKFLFIDTLPTEVFRGFRIQLFGQIKDQISCEYHGGPENPSHITVGYGESKRVNLALLARIPAPAQARTGAMRICVAGERGTCSEAIASFQSSS